MVVTNSIRDKNTFIERLCQATFTVRVLRHDVYDAAVLFRHSAEITFARDE